MIEEVPLRIVVLTAVTKVTTKLLIGRRDSITTSYCSTQKESICCHVHVIQDQEKHQDGPPQEEVLWQPADRCEDFMPDSCQVQQSAWPCGILNGKFHDICLDMSSHIYVTCLIRQMPRKPHGLDKADTWVRSPHSLLQSQKFIFSWLFLTASTIKTMCALGSHKSYDNLIIFNHYMLKKQNNSTTQKQEYRTPMIKM